MKDELQEIKDVQAMVDVLRTQGLDDNEIKAVLEELDVLNLENVELELLASGLMPNEINEFWQTVRDSFAGMEDRDEEVV